MNITLKLSRFDGLFSSLAAIFFHVIYLREHFGLDQGKNFFLIKFDYSHYLFAG